MPVSLGQQRVAIGAMARSAAPKPRSPVGLHWNKWLRDSDPMAYKACFVFLVTIARMIVSGVKQGTEKIKEMVKEGHEGVCGLASRGMTQVLAMRLRPIAVPTKSLVPLLMILLCGHILQLHYHDTNVASSVELFPNPVREETVSTRKVLNVSEGTRIVCVNEMLLMIAGDVEPNPGPDTLQPNDIKVLVNELTPVKDKWYELGIQLNLLPSDLNSIWINRINDPSACLLEMLTVWLDKTTPSPTWQTVVDALQSPALSKHPVAEYIRKKYLSKDDSEPTVFCGEVKLKAEIQQLQDTFIELKDEVFEVVKEKPVDTFKVRLLSMDVDGEEHYVPLLKEIVGRHKEVVDIWVELSSHMNFLNYEILPHILKKFRNKELEKRMDLYVDRIKEFFKNTLLSDFFKCWPIRGKTPPAEDLRNFLTAKTTKEWSTCTLEDLDNVKQNLAKKLLLPSFALDPAGASEGCVCMVYSIPPFLVSVIQTRVRNIPFKELADMEVEWMTVENPLLLCNRLLRQIYISRTRFDLLSDYKPRDLLPFRLAMIEKQILSASNIDRFTRETLRGDMDDVVYKKTVMELRELGVMKDGSQPQVVLIEGAPGIGKTAFAWEQCWQWAEGNVLGDYSIVLLLPLRDNNIRQIRSLPDLFQHIRGQVREEVSRRVAESGGKGCLIWLEGWDELPSDLRESDSFFSQLIRGIQLPAATIFITSRPWSTRGLLEIVGERLPQRTELLALAKEEVNKLIANTTGLSETAFAAYIESNPMIRAAMYTPVSAAIVEQVFRSAPHNPLTTVTQLYSAYVLMRLEQYLSQHPKYSHIKIKVRTLADLPEEVMGDLQVLCHLAYKGVSQQMIVFSSVPEGVSTLGLLQTVPQVYDEGEERVSYNFLHYTVQEYLAALHLSHLQSQELLNIVDINYQKMLNTGYSKEYYEATQYKTTFQFLAGITKLEPFPVDFLSDLLEKDVYRAIMYRWLYESQNQSLLTSVLGSGEREMRLSHSATTIDYFVAGYCLAHSNCTWRIFGSVGDIGIEFYNKGCNHQIPETGSSSQLVSAEFYSGLITEECIRYFLTFPKSLLQHIQYLRFLYSKLDRRGCDLLAEGVHRMPCLEKLDLYGNTSIGCGGTVKLISSLHSSELKELDISGTGISDPDFESLANYIHSSSSLEELSIGDNEISVESMDILCRALSANSSMRILKISYCDLTASHCVCLGQLLRLPIHCQIERLDISRYSLTSDGLGEIMSGLSNNITLKELDMCFNNIGSEGGITVATMLKINSSLEKLNLSECGIDSRGGAELGAALERNKTLRELNLSDNALGYDGVKGLCASLENNTSLKQLYLLDDKSIGRKGEHLLTSFHKRHNCYIHHGIQLYDFTPYVPEQYSEEQTKRPETTPLPSLKTKRTGLIKEESGISRSKLKDTENTSLLSSEAESLSRSSMQHLSTTLKDVSRPTYNEQKCDGLLSLQSKFTILGVIVFLGIALAVQNIYHYGVKPHKNTNHQTVSYCGKIVASEKWHTSQPSDKLLQSIIYIDDGGKDQTFYFLDKIQNDCVNLGIELIDDLDTIRGIEQKVSHLNDPIRICREILKTWRDRNDDNATWHALLVALRNIQHSGTCSHLLKALTLYHHTNSGMD